METTGFTQPACMTKAQRKALVRAIRRGRTEPSLLSDLEGCGPVRELEDAIAERLDVPYVLAVSSCTAALHTALLALGTGPGDEVVVTSYTWPQSVSPILFSGAQPVFADIDPHTLPLDLESVSRRISDRTKAIIPVHLFGQVEDMEKLEDLCRQHGIAIISDAAQAFASTFMGRSVAGYGDCTCFSLGRGKLVCGGEGGVLATRDKTLFDRAMMLTQHPDRLKHKYAPNELPAQIFNLNSRMHPVAAVLAMASLEEVNVRLLHRHNVQEAFWYGIDGNPLIIPPEHIQTTLPEPYGIPATFLGDAQERHELAARANMAGIPLRMGPIARPLHKEIAAFRKWLPNAEALTGCAAQELPAVQKRCSQEELWVLSTVDMDILTPKDAYVMGRRLARLV